MHWWLVLQIFGLKIWFAYINNIVLLTNDINNTQLQKIVKGEVNPNIDLYEFTDFTPTEI